MSCDRLISKDYVKKRSRRGVSRVSPDFRFLSEYLVDWNGRDHFLCILELTRFLQITDFQELYDTILCPIEAHFDSYSTVEQVRTAIM
jgi:hypothetical protein